MTSEPVGMVLNDGDEVALDDILVIGAQCPVCGQPLKFEQEDDAPELMDGDHLSGIAAHCCKRSYWLHLATVTVEVEDWSDEKD
jgi:uncharacterized protein with PIN domain